MKYFAILIISLVSSGAFCQDSLDTDLQRRINNAYTLHDAQLDTLIKYYLNELDTSKFKLPEINKNLMKIDSINAFEIKYILGNYGFPGYDLVGKEYSYSFWQLVWSADIELKNEALPKMGFSADM